VSFKRGFEVTQGIRGKLLGKSAVEATSLGLKTKLGLGPNSRDIRGLYTSERSLLLIGRTIE